MVSCPPPEDKGGNRFTPWWNKTLKISDPSLFFLPGLAKADLTPGLRNRFSQPAIHLPGPEIALDTIKSNGLGRSHRLIFSLSVLCR